MMRSLSPGGRLRPALPGRLHLPPVQPGPVPPRLQEHQSHAEHPGGEAAAPPPGHGAWRRTGSSRNRAGIGLKEGDGSKSVAAH